MANPELQPALGLAFPTNHGAGVICLRVTLQPGPDWLWPASLGRSCCCFPSFCPVETQRHALSHRSSASSCVTGSQDTEQLGMVSHGQGADRRQEGAGSALSACEGTGE